ncbi:amino acid ABC transporter substrate-binding protein [Roseibium denhamense]|uniref:General L-amino acid transport system substrate-binding protein n=1 Tax=Roseibium denhamense TaxID=76305 RepID=A0ABY1NQN0_9HYPH|nr:amino acid ABC transporter substrate-binding protein [Roseibium denhamense]MTI07994.1 amino acid ABC transporter substrate-binding protein [Roseibium denhamense]SMP15535.1 general L-amino acid transport system substrate-binding protein [Roseibium denhamense]
MKRTASKIILAIATLGVNFVPAAAATLDTVRENGFFTCGVSQGNPGFSNPDAEGAWTGLDVDYCRAIAAAVFDDPTAVKFRPLSSPERFTALQSGEIDVLSRTTTWTMSRDTNLGANFAGVMYYDGQAMMVRKELGITSALELAGASVCTATGTTTELNVADYFRVNDMPYEVVAFEKNDEVTQAYDAGRCDVYTTDKSGLHANRLKLTNPEDHMILPEIISKEPLGPVVRQGDDKWFNIAKWTLNVLINAEELGVTQQNVDEMLGSDNPSIKRLLGVDGNFGEALGLDKDWAVRIIRAVGNYGDVFERNVGPETPLEISRGINALWNDGGVLYAPPIR